MLCFLILMSTLLQEHSPRKNTERTDRHGYNIGKSIHHRFARKDQIDTVTILKRAFTTELHGKIRSTRLQYWKEHSPQICTKRSDRQGYNIEKSIHHRFARKEQIDTVTILKRAFTTERTDRHSLRIAIVTHTR